MRAGMDPGRSEGDREAACDDLRCTCAASARGSASDPRPATAAKRRTARHRHGLPTARRKDLQVLPGLPAPRGGRAGRRPGDLRPRCAAAPSGDRRRRRLPHRHRPQRLLRPPAITQESLRPHRWRGESGPAPEAGAGGARAVPGGPPPHSPQPQRPRLAGSRLCRVHLRRDQWDHRYVRQGGLGGDHQGAPTRSTRSGRSGGGSRRRPDCELASAAPFPHRACPAGPHDGRSDRGARRVPRRRDEHWNSIAGCTGVTLCRCGRRATTGGGGSPRPSRPFRWTVAAWRRTWIRLACGAGGVGWGPASTATAAPGEAAPGLQRTGSPGRGIHFLHTFPQLLAGPHDIRVGVPGRLLLELRGHLPVVRRGPQLDIRRPSTRRTRHPPPFIPCGSNPVRDDWNRPRPKR